MYVKAVVQAAFETVHAVHTPLGLKYPSAHELHANWLFPMDWSPVSHVPHSVSLANVHALLKNCVGALHTLQSAHEVSVGLYWPDLQPHCRSATLEQSPFCISELEHTRHAWQLAMSRLLRNVLSGHG